MVNLYHICILLMDIYLSLESSNVNAPQLILISLSCLMICFKFEEAYFFNVQHALDIADALIASNSMGENIQFSKERMVKTELKILETVEWKLFTPNIYTFIVRYLKASDSDIKRNTIDKNKIIEIVFNF